MGDNSWTVSLRAAHTVLRTTLVAGVLWSAAGTVGFAQSAVAADVSSLPKQTAGTVTLMVANAPLDSVLQTIAQQAGVNLFLNKSLVSPRRVTLDLRGVPMEDAFERALTGTGLKATVVAGSVILKLASATAPMMQGSVTGTVMDAVSKQPLNGATVTLDRAERGVSTDARGRYRFPVVTPGSHVITVRRLGYVKTTKAITVVDGQSLDVDIALAPSVSTLDQIVVTGTVVATERKALPNAISVITAKDIEQRGITQIEQLFRGDVPGLFAQERGERSPLDSVVLFSRGATMLPPRTVPPTPATSAIKTYVDGVELANPAYLNQIDPKSIERIEILTGPQASTIYGTGAINGVMQIFTKRGSDGQRPQLTASLVTGAVQNNFSTSMTPRHDVDAQVSGTEGHWSYRAGGSWNFLGYWTPQQQPTTLSGFGGTRAQYGTFTADASVRIGRSTNHARGYIAQAAASRSASGDGSPGSYVGASAPTNSFMNGQTLGLTLGFAPLAWWSHEAVIGQDVSDVGIEQTRAAYGYGGSDDSLLYISASHSARRSLRYATTLRVPITTVANAVITAGADQWNSMYTFMYGTPASLTGTLSGISSNQRLPGRNTGAFAQAQMGFRDALFMTYGLRAEWNPNYGENVNPNIAPRYGAAYSSELGAVTAKVRASYGKATRPPTRNQQAKATANSSIYGVYVSRLENLDLEPEFQQGAEGGVELYFGNRGSLVVTRYNQTVDNLIAAPRVDSVPSLAPNTTTGLYTYAGVTQNLNIGSVRNQGWELQGTVNVGALTTKGTYSWTKSRVLGITEKFRASFTDVQWQPGSTYDFVPEHTWALINTYAHRGTTVTLAVNGTGMLFRYTDQLNARISSRLPSNRPRMSLPSYRPRGDGYAMADLTASHRFSRSVEGLLQVQNLMDFYRNDYGEDYATIGRQTKVGVRVRY